MRRRGFLLGAAALPAVLALPVLPAVAAPIAGVSEAGVQALVGMSKSGFTAAELHAISDAAISYYLNRGLAA